MSLSTSVLKQVLVATDLAASSGRAVARGLMLAAARGAELDIVHVMEEGVPGEAQAEITATDEKAIRDTLAANPLSEQVKVTIDMVVGNAETDIVERAVMTNADCIVLGLHERILRENLAIEGTIAESVIGASTLPVLLVRSEPREPYRTVVVGIDFSALSHAAIEAAALIAPDASLYLVHAYEGDNEHVHEAERRLKSLVSSEGHIFERAAKQVGVPAIAVRTIAEQGKPRDALKTQINRLGADLLVMGTRGRTGLTRSLLGSVTTDLINDRLCDVLVIRPE